MVEFTCDQCGVTFKAYQSQRRGKHKFCSPECKGLFQKESFSGPRNPNYKGVDIGNSFCQCGSQKDYRARLCSRCAKTSTPVGEPVEIALTPEIVKAIQESRDYLEISDRTGLNRKTISRIIKDNDVDVSHLRRCRRRPSTAEAVLVKHNRGRNNGIVKALLLRENLLEYRCQKCGLGPEWEGSELTLELDHKNGDCEDDRLENLRFLCPNCHSQTSTWRGRASRGVKKRKKGDAHV